MSKKLDLRKLKADAESAVVEVKQESEERTDVIPREVTFSLSYDAPDGEVYQDDVLSIILDSDGRLTKTRVFNGLTRGMIAGSLPESEQLKLDALARVLTQLKDPPDWVIKWAGEDMELLSHINAALVEHETRYFRGNNRKGEGGALKPRVSVDCALFKTTGIAAP